MDEPIIAFIDEYRFLSNFANTPLVFNGRHYLNAESAFQASKCVNDNAKKQFESLPPNKAKALGRKVQLRPDWEKIKNDVMFNVVLAKFQDPKLAMRLIATGDAPLEEGNTWDDTYWGIDLKTGRGQNNLGKILMKVRSILSLREKNKQS